MNKKSNSIGVKMQMENYKEELEEKRPRGGSFHQMKSFREPKQEENPEAAGEEEGNDFNDLDEMMNVR